ncbi:alkane 1-monooxygenase [Pelagivirga sediminicola]|uniref:Alkane 1-monooxygenase n=1 Tax=Pelagivirga sediminicola TaxID=2170575 RepID=A0A2T7G707_9RHOB|nr:alkane 1-monooxygenase [Pelagivirga sediminicola]PVA10204.1 alkane 1-monooxygenase [Pelagivirga sediminicola]
MLMFYGATLAPLAMIALGATTGGPWPALALGYMTVPSFALDRLSARRAEDAGGDGEFPAAIPLLPIIGLAHLLLLALVVRAIAMPAETLGALGPWQRAFLGLATALVFGQISHPAAHELIHKPARLLRLMGRLIYTSLLVGHHASAHLRVHHVLVASDGDPNSARRGEGFYRFALRAGPGSFKAGLAADTAMLRRAGRPVWRHPYVLYCVGGVACMGAALALGGVPGLAAYVAICLYAQMQILMSDYVQHYGLRRQTLPGGRLEPVGPQHSWNTPHRFSSAMTLNAPRHSDHHVNPARVYPALRLRRADMPVLPYPLPAMAALSLVPPLWRRVMDRRLDRWTSPPGAG